MPDPEQWRRFREGFVRVVRVVDRIILVSLVVLAVLLVLGIGFCLVEYARM